MTKKLNKAAIEILKDVSKKAELEDAKFTSSESLNEHIKKQIKFWIYNNVKKPIDAVIKHSVGEIGIVELRERNTI